MTVRPPRSRLLPRQAEGDRRPLPRLRKQLDAAAMRLDELPGERQAEAERRLPALCGAVEAVEDPRLVRGRDAAAIVRDRDRRLAFRADPVDEDAAAIARVGNRVPEHVVERLAEALAVAGDGAEAPLQLHGEVDPLRRRLRLE